ncbi:glutathione-regulated potassium-efflux system ancillary protein KefG [Vibrio sp. SS-MA-C1-2]|uniref:glutathione-regulated potassium-efflux system ancillary protein KefG n=1 Tax=Vibrio sp. SS-MA-C1-2 TaxID=2908646 RepID=UPI001F29C3E4|nr:glutathione-regulated potassium-efflux system ancillary protein KefG [Vibrio sp. SS-MA-C1-2]UJF19208.1 glutathione-regulated potassium-efflux system ancillary protein KefG [Vibrio sp. SS-MA-C1-2]
MKGKPKPKVLVIYVHPYPQDSVANAEMIKHISMLDHVTVHDLYAEYPNFFIDTVREQALVNAHDIIVFQHPLYMYSCPALMKEWLDVVLGQGFAYGKSGDALMGKYWRSVITTGGAKTAFTSSGYNRYSLNEILQPFELTAALCRMEWLPPLVLYWARSVGEQERKAHCDSYYQWLDNPLFIEGDLS